MNRLQASLFVTPIGISSCTLFLLSAWRGEALLPFTDNSTYGPFIGFLLLTSFIYFLTDFIMMIRDHKPSYNIYYIHHMLGIISIPSAYFYHYYMIKYILAYLMFELSTPYLNIAIYFHKNKLQGWLVVLNDIIFVTTYTCIRIIFGTYLTYSIVTLMASFRYPLYFAIILPLTLQTMNYYWYIRIIGFMTGNN
jgi:hypothetical protein